MSIQILATINATLAAEPIPPSSRSERDLEMHQTRNGNQWYFGMNLNLGVDGDSGLVSTTANVKDVTKAHSPLQFEKPMACRR